jgi:hypothetical protein
MSLRSAALVMLVLVSCGTDVTPTVPRLTSQSAAEHPPLRRSSRAHSAASAS